MKNSLERKSQRTEMKIIPESIDDREGMVVVDVTWGEIQPIRAAEGVRTVGEPEVIEHLKNEQPMIDVRAPGTRHGVGIPGTTAIPIGDITDHLNELDQTTFTIFFCNGPQCPQSPKAINRLIEAGFPADSIGYYRGGMHNWITLGLPVINVE